MEYNSSNTHLRLPDNRGDYPITGFIAIGLMKNGYRFIPNAITAPMHPATATQLIDENVGAGKEDTGVQVIFREARLSPALPNAGYGSM